MAGCVRVLCAEGWTEGVDIAHTASECFNVELAGASEVGRLSEEVFFIVDFSFFERNDFLFRLLLLFFLLFLLLFFRLFLLFSGWLFFLLLFGFVLFFLLLFLGFLGVVYSFYFFVFLALVLVEFHFVDWALVGWQ